MRYMLFINNKWSDPHSGEYFDASVQDLMSTNRARIQIGRPLYVISNARDIDHYCQQMVDLPGRNVSLYEATKRHRRIPSVYGVA